jgi:hypothetical protein
MKYFTYIAISLFAATVLFAQSAPDTLWTRTYGGSADDNASQVIQTSDGGYVIVGVTASFDVSGNDVYLIRTNANGDTLYSRTYGGTGNQFARSVVETPDHGFLIDGDTDQLPGGVTDPYLIRTNASGDTLWTRIYGYPESAWLSSACAAYEGGYVLCGQLNGYSHVVKIDENGNTVWARSYGGGGHAWQVRPASDGGYVVTGQAGYPMYGMKIDSIGNEVWYRTASGGAGVGVTETQDHGVVITGDGYGYFVATRFDSSGNEQWSRTYAGYYSRGHSVSACLDGSFVYGGAISPAGGPGQNYRPMLIKSDANGNMLWSRTYDSGVGVCFYGQMTADGGYIYYSATYEDNVDWDIMLVKFAPDPSNIPPCPPTPLPFVDNFDSPTLDSCWSWIREDTSHWSLTERQGWMRIVSQYEDIVFLINRPTWRRLISRILGYFGR